MPRNLPLWIAVALLALVAGLQWRILNRSLPGAETTPAPAPAAPALPPESTAPLRQPAHWGLVGTVIGAQPQDSQAWIVDLACSSPAVHQAGAVLADGSTIVSIAPRHVVAERQGQRYEIVQAPAAPEGPPGAAASPAVPQDTSRPNLFSTLRSQSQKRRSIPAERLEQYGEVVEPPPPPPE